MGSVWHFAGFEFVLHELNLQFAFDFRDVNEAMCHRCIFDRRTPAVTVHERKTLT